MSYLLTFSRLSLADEICINDASPLISCCKISRASEQAAIASVCSVYLYWKEARDDSLKDFASSTWSYKSVNLFSKEAIDSSNYYF